MWRIVSCLGATVVGVTACALRVVQLRPVTAEPAAAVVVAGGLSGSVVRLAVPADGYLAVLRADDSGAWAVLYPEMHQRGALLHPGVHDVAFTGRVVRADSPVRGKGMYSEQANCYPDVVYAGKVPRIVQECRGRLLTGGPPLIPHRYLIVLTSHSPVKSRREQREIFSRHGLLFRYRPKPVWVHPSEIARTATLLLFGEDAQAAAAIYQVVGPGASR